MKLKAKDQRKKISRHSLKKSTRVFRYIRPYRWIFVTGFIFLFLTSGVALVFPKLMGNLVDASKTSLPDGINRTALLLLLLFAAQSVFSFLRIYLFAIVTEKSLAALRNDVFSHLMTLPMRFFSARRVGELNSRLSSDVSLLQETFTITIAEFLRQLIIVIGGIVFLSLISIKLTFFMLALVPVLVLSAVFFGRFIRRLSKKGQEVIAVSNTVAEESFQGISIVKAFANEPFEIMRYGKAMMEVVRFGLKRAKWRGAFASFIIFCLFGSIVATTWYGALLVQSGQGLTVGDLFSFILYTVFIGASIGGIANQYSSIQRAIGATEDILDLLDEKGEDVSVTVSKPLAKRLRGEVEFERVRFSYPGRKNAMVLDDISFRAEPGSKVAIVGPSGAGKSTIVSLILRFYDPDSGIIRFDGKEAGDYPLSGLRNQMAVVPQEVILFGGSIRENIAYGKPGALTDEIVHAAQQANADAFIREFPEGYDTVVGERGMQLSGGQRQRIAIARAVLKDPSILILDEATSSLDSESEQLVQEALEKLMQGRTSFVIAHRLSTIRKADRILVLDKGRIRETGTHETLISAKGLYHSLCKLQFDSGE